LEIEPNNIVSEFGGPTGIPQDPTRPKIHVDSTTGKLYFWDPNVGFFGEWVIKSLDTVKNTTLHSCGVTGAILRPEFTNSWISIGPTGTGFICATPPDGTPNNGACRGINAVDWQIKRLASFQIASGDYSFIGGGKNNMSTGSFSVVVGGKSNLSSKTGSLVLGGSNNKSKGSYTTIGGGQSNTALLPWSTVGGGLNNLCRGTGAFIGGGLHNSIILGKKSTICGGSYNTINRKHDCFIGGGFHNYIYGDYATILGGGNNTAANTGVFIAGGRRNIATSIYSSILNGHLNKTIGKYSTILNGICNRTNGDYSLIGNGKANYTNGVRACVLNGNCNVASNSYTFIGNGTYHRATGKYSTILNGNSGFASGKYSVILSGKNNTASADFSVIINGINNKVSQKYGMIGNGNNNTITGISCVIGSGSSNTTSNSYSSIISGKCNRITGTYGFIGSGKNNYVFGNHSSIINGVDNTCTGDYSIILNGKSNFANNAFCTVSGYYASATHSGSFLWSDQSSNTPLVTTANNQFRARASGGATFFSNSAMTLGATLLPGATSWSVTSDRNVKTNLVEVDTQEVLTKLTKLPIYKWNAILDPTTNQVSDIDHIGPMAQDFHEIFALGNSDKLINMADIDGVTIAAIQALNLKVDAVIAKESCCSGRVSGQCVLDFNGNAVVDLSDSIRDRVHYLLTPIGSAAPNLHIAKEYDPITKSFTIGGGLPGTKVSWKIYS
jgi:hypothetical protein